VQSSIYIVNELRASRSDSNISVGHIITIPAQRPVRSIGESIYLDSVKTVRASVLVVIARETGIKCCSLPASA